MLRSWSRASSALALMAVAACGVEVTTTQPTTMHSARKGIVGGQVLSGLAAVGALVYEGHPFCTGTLVTSRVVVTAAHCLEGIDAAAVRFVLGTYAEQPEYDLAVSRVVPHPYFNAYHLVHDIGGLVLESAAPVAPMRALGAMDDSFVGERLLFVGFGVTGGYSQSGGGTKRAVSIPVVDVEATTFSYAEAGRNTCNGDSGGPAFYLGPDDELLLAGVTSWGDRYCRSYGVDTRVDAYLDFFGIEGVMASPSSDEPPPQPDLCRGETYEGRCDRGSVVYCEDDRVHELDCARAGLRCGWDRSKQIFNCLR